VIRLPSVPGRGGVPATVGATLLAAVLGGTLLAGCSSDVGSSGDQGYVAGKGVITTLAVADRERPGPVSGTTLEGRPASLAQHRGKVVVVNVWGSWCPPCRAEAPMLAAASRDLGRKGVVFLGIDSRNPERAGPLAFQRRYQVPYESIYDPDGRSLLAFHGTLSPSSIPSTDVIDRQGRVAASVIGEVSRTTLYDLVDEVAGRGRA
jgi:thiol-disulfide isomerase/thioredoxin